MFAPLQKPIERYLFKPGNLIKIYKKCINETEYFLYLEKLDDKTHSILFNGKICKLHKLKISQRLFNTISYCINPAYICGLWFGINEIELVN